jgi:hypothetical protein
MPIVSKTNDNPFLTSILLYNNHRNVNTVELKSAEIPIGFYNIRSPYNTFIVNGVTYTVPPGNYTVDTLIDAMNFTSPYIFSRNGNRIVITLGNPLPEAVTNFVASNPQETTVDLVWDPALYATSYSIESSPPTTTQTTSDTFITFIELTPNTEYTFTITAVNITGNGPPTTSDPVSTLLPLPGFAPAMFAEPTNVTATTMDLAWSEYVPEYATSFNVYAYSVLDGLIGFVNVPISSFSYTYTGLTPDTEYYFTVAGVNATGPGPQDGAPTVYTYTLI